MVILGIINNVMGSGAGWDFLVSTCSSSLKVSCPRRGNSHEGRFPYWHKGVRGVLPVPPTTASFCSLKVSCPRRGHSHEGRFPYWHKGVRGVLPVPPTTASFCSLKVACPRRGHSHIRRGLHSLGLTGTTGSGLRPRAQMFQKPMIFEQICILSPLISTQVVQFLNAKICPALWK